MIRFTKVALPFGWLGNMSRHPIEHEGKVWTTAEALFQALRFSADSPVREAIRLEKSPMGAKMKAKKHLGEAIILPRNLEDMKNMVTVIRLKTEQHPDLLAQLLATGEEEIVEDVSARMSESGLFWGKGLANGVWVGQNWLGRIWMAKRDKELNGNRD